MLESTGRLPDYAVACVGGGSNAIGLFFDFINDRSVRLIGVEAGGESMSQNKHAATLVAGKVGVLHGSMSYLLQDSHGQISDTHSISAGLDYPGVGPEHSYLKETGRASYVSVVDSEALEGFQLLCRTEGIIPALESSHALYYASELAAKLTKEETIVVGLSGRGDKDIETVADSLEIKL
tara:strand:- start:32 stop:571 length:540 start_codon:yes stop_codon:yes gene_type:complete